jgi:hypothetical protein
MSPLKKIVTLFLIVLLSVGSVGLVPQKTEAASFKEIAGPFVGGAASCAANYLVSALTNLLSSLKSVPTNDDATASMNIKNCIDSIAAAAAQVLLKKLTQETVAWVNNGFKGAPFYIQDSKSFFKSVGDGEMTTYLGGLVTSQNPFTRDVARGLIQDYTGNSIKGFTLDQDIGANWQDFNNDFSVGGWGGFLAMTQNDDNNPIGARLLAKKSATAQVAKSKETLQTELSQNQGFLSFKKCVDPQNYQELPAQYNRVELTLQAQNDPHDADTIQAMQILAQYPECARYETQTPGGLISDKLARTVNVTEDKLINANNLNEALTAIFTKLMTQLFNKGIASLAGNQTFTPSAGTGGYGSNTSYTQLQNTGTQGGVTGTNWYESDETFDITTDLPEVVQVQQNYIAALQDYNAALVALIDALKQLDYCLPGPRLDWETEARQSLENFLAALNYDDNDEIGQGIFMALLGFPLNEDGTSAVGKSFVDGELHSIFDQYTAKINSKYFSGNAAYVPVFATTARNEISKLDTYRAKISANDSTIGQAQGNIYVLNSYLIPKIQTMVTNHNNGTITDSEYEQQLTSYKNLFANLPVVNQEIVNTTIANKGVTDAQFEYIGSTASTSLLSLCQSTVTGTMAQNRRPYPGLTNANGSGSAWSYAVDISVPRAEAVPNPYNSDTGNGRYCYFDHATMNACLNSGSATSSGSADSTFAPFENMVGIY